MFLGHAAADFTMLQTFLSQIGRFCHNGQQSLSKVHFLLSCCKESIEIFNLHATRGQAGKREYASLPYLWRGSVFIQ